MSDEATPDPPGLADASPTIGKIAGALAKVRGTIGPILKDKEAKIKTRTGADYGYTYSDLASVVEASAKPLADAEVAVFQRCREGSKLETVLTHSSGEWIAGWVPMQFKGGGPQDFGSAMTYARRYGLLAMLGLAPEDDDGARAQQTQKAAPQQQRRAATRQSQQTKPQQQQQPQSNGGLRYEPPQPEPSEPLPRTTSQRVEVAALLKSLKRKRSIAGVDAWTEENADELKSLDTAERKQVIDEYRAHRKQLHGRAPDPQQQVPPVDNDRAERVALETEAKEAEAYFDATEHANNDPLRDIF